MSSDGPDGKTQRDPVLTKLDELDRLDNSHDPTVMLFSGADGDPVVAKYGDELRMLSSNVIYARRVSVDDIRKEWDESRSPWLVDLSTQSARFDATDFAEVAGLE